MQVPEKLALIGGSILLSSTLIFTLKSQASHILPKWTSTLENIDDDSTSITNPNDRFFKSYERAQQKHWRTGHWGSSRYYIDDHENMHVGKGNLVDPIYDNIGTDEANRLNTLSFDENVSFPADARRILGNMANVTSIQGTDKIDTSHTKDLFSSFSNDVKLTSLDLNSWDISHVTRIGASFSNDPQLSSLQVNDWDTSHTDDMGWLFYGTKLSSLDLSHWDTSHVHTMFNMFAHNADLEDVNLQNFDTTNTDTDYMFGKGKYSNFPVEAPNTSIGRLTLGSKTDLSTKSGLVDSEWKNGNNSLHNDQFNSTGHAGTWIKQ